ncbi:MAG: hypothetical protein ABFS46_04005, partial [Myxococcota bacterium]
APFKWSHSLQLAPEVLNVPLIVRVPGSGSGFYEGVTRSMDVFPTLASLASVPVASGVGVTGEDLSHAIRGDAPARRLAAPSHTAVLARSVFRQMHEPRWSEVWAVARSYFPRIDVGLVWVSIRDEDIVYKHQKVEEGRWEMQVFDLASDPGETRNLYDPGDVIHTAMAGALEDYKARLVEHYPEPGSETPGQLPRQNEAELLRSLGYIR